MPIRRRSGASSRACRSTARAGRLAGGGREGGGGGGKADGRPARRRGLSQGPGARAHAARARTGAGKRMSWVGRSLRRFEDRALLLGRGRFTADTAHGAAIVRFARSPVARGRIRSIAKPEGALVFTAADLGDVKPIRPLLHRPDYVPIAQPE